MDNRKSVGDPSGMDSWSIPKKTSTDATPSDDANPMPSSIGTIPRKSFVDGSNATNGSGKNHNINTTTTNSSPSEPSIPRKRPSSQQQLSASTNAATVTSNNDARGSSTSATKRDPRLTSLTGENPSPTITKRLKRRSLPSSSALSSTSSSSSSSNSSTPSNVVSTSPFVIRISLKGVAWRGSEGITQTATRASKRDRPVYQELAETDDEMDLLTDSSEEEDVVPQSASKSKRQKTLKKGRSSPADEGHVMKAASAAKTMMAKDTLKQNVLSVFAAGPSVNNMNTVTAKDFLLLGNVNTDSPPQGALTTLWYSREVFVNVFVLEKIIVSITSMLCVLGCH
jgi:uncharacterized membrane protein YfbV (UPF0208 family)